MESTYTQEASCEANPPCGRGCAPSVKGNSRDTGQERVEGLLRGVYVVLRHHRAPQVVLDSLREQLSPWLDADELVFMARAKYFTAVWTARLLRSELPKEPDVAMPFTGHWKRWARVRLKKATKRTTHLWYSILQCKRSCLPPTDEMLYQSYLDHRAGMATMDPLVDEDFEEIKEVLEPILIQINRRVLELYRPETMGVLGEGHTGLAKYHASSRACYDGPRASGGQLGYLVRDIFHGPLVNSDEAYDMAGLWDHLEQRERPDRFVEDHVFIGPNGPDLFPVSRSPEFEAEWQRRGGLTVDSYITGPRVLRAQIQGVLEPLKVRVISKGPAAEYYCSRGLQKALHQALREIPCFRLIGEPVSAIHLMDIVRTLPLTPDGKVTTVWLSADYKAATDNLSARLSSWILGVLTRGQPDAWRSLWASVLAPHFVEYPRVRERLPIPPVMQQNGQLMGSILSFPVLCLANLGLFLWFERLCGRPCSLRAANRAVLINGDDLVAQIRRSEFPLYRDLANRVGLPLSVGKLYIHNRVLNVNSTCFWYNPSGTPWRIDYLNVGLFFGQGKVMAREVLGSTEVSEIRVVSATFDQLVAGSLPGKQAQCELAALFIQENRDTLSSECRGRNLFLPIALGGMGCTPPIGFKVRITNRQKRVFKQLLDAQPCLDRRPLTCGESREPIAEYLPWETMETVRPKPPRAGQKFGAACSYIGVGNLATGLIPRELDSMAQAKSIFSWLSVAEAVKGFDLTSDAIPAIFDEYRRQAQCLVNPLI